MNLRFFPFSKKKHQDLAEFIFKNYYKSAYYTAYKYCNNDLLAEEAAQESIYKAIKNITQLKDSGKLESWVKTIARNTVLDMLRKSNKVMPMEVISSVAVSGSNPLYIVENNEIINEVGKILNTLSEPYHSAIHLFYYMELKITEISDVLEIPEGTVKSLLHRGRNIIRQELLKKGFLEYRHDGEVTCGE